jgi:hypothetical protein
VRDISFEAGPAQRALALNPEALWAPGIEDNYIILK